MTVFADSSGFIGVLVSTDANHPSAAETWRAMVERRVDIVTTNYVTIETIAILHKRHGANVVRAFTQQVLPLVSVVWIDEARHNNAVQAVTAGSRQGPSLVDCVSFAVMDRRGIDQVLAFDEHFTRRGYRLYS